MGKLPPRTAEFVEKLRKNNIEMGDTLLWWIAIGYDAPRLIADTVKNAGSKPEEIAGYWNTLKRGQASTAISPGRRTITTATRTRGGHVPSQLAEGKAPSRSRLATRRDCRAGPVHGPGDRA